MIVIRLKRIGRKNNPVFRIVVQDKQKAPTSTVIEKVGTYDPNTNPSTVTIEKDRVKYWLGQGAQPSPTVHNMLINDGILTGDKKRVVQPKIKKENQDLKDKKDEEDKEEKKEEKKEEPKKE
ncbi:MAG: 30S ribosomal protein S16 [Patescibacteria group bacterium]